MQRFGVKRKLAPHYIGPYEIVEICGPVAYQIQLPEQLSAIHDVFHVSQLKKCVQTPTEILVQEQLQIEPDLTYAEYPAKVLDRKERRTRRKVVKMYKILWNNHTEDEATWETEEYLNTHFQGFLSRQGGKDCAPPLVTLTPESRDEIPFKGVGCDDRPQISRVNLNPSP